MPQTSIISKQHLIIRKKIASLAYVMTEEKR